ncbi:EAL domain-containing protein [Sporanaerobacter sp.]|uniref:EAL domain-containing protein n=1 Tax=Sporanaerobacter sp. TaxID=2010183 RepID=UPI003A1009F1
MFIMACEPVFAEEIKVLRVAGDNNHPPYEFIDEKGNYKGFNVDIMRAIAIEEGIEIEIIPMAWNQAVYALEAGKVDAIQGMSKTPTRANKFLFSIPTVKNSQAIFVLKDTNYISGIEDLTGVKVAFQKGDINEEILNDISRVILRPKDNQKDGIEALLNGEVEAFLGNRQTGLYYLQKMKKADMVKIVGEPMGEVEYGPVTTKDKQEVADILNRGIKEIKRNGTYDKIYQKWFGEEYYGKKDLFKVYKKQIVVIVFVILLVFFILSGWNKQLATEVEKRTSELEEANKNLISHQEQIYRLAYYDAITDLPNRLYLAKKFSDIVEEIEKKGNRLAVLYFDIDRFKDINDTLGHDTGDHILNLVGKRIENIIKDGDILARFGGDEFLILMKNIEDENEVVEFAKQVLDKMSEPFLLSRYKHFLTASVGVSIYPEGGKDFTTLVKNADMAMYRAKKSGGNNLYIYNKELSDIEINKVKTISQLRRAVERNEFELYYQPKIDINSGEVQGMEALIRWNSPDKGLIGPNHFIPIAEEMGLILPIGEWVLREACRQNKAWMDKGYKPIRVSVNISGVQFQQKDFVDIVENILESTGLESQYLELEITESIAMTDIKYTIEVLKKMKSLGVYISIDDFGTGYSSFSYLKEMSVDELKIDRTFIMDVNTNTKNMSIVKAIIHLAHELNLQVTAEGAETIEHIQFLKENNCDKVQGYFYSKPVSSKGFEKFLK